MGLLVRCDEDSALNRQARCGFLNTISSSQRRSRAAASDSACCRIPRNTFVRKFCALRSVWKPWRCAALSSSSAGRTLLDATPSRRSSTGCGARCEGMANLRQHRSARSGRRTAPARMSRNISERRSAWSAIRGEPVQTPSAFALAHRRARDGDGVDGRRRSSYAVQPCAGDAREASASAKGCHLNYDRYSTTRVCVDGWRLSMGFLFDKMDPAHDRERCLKPRVCVGGETVSESPCAPHTAATFTPRALCAHSD